MPTLQDIIGELAKPGRDPRAEFEAFKYEESVQSIDDLKAGMKLPGIVTNVTKFGAYVDIGVHAEIFLCFGPLQQFPAHQRFAHQGGVDVQPPTIRLFLDQFSHVLSLSIGMNIVRRIAHQVASDRIECQKFFP